MATTPDGSVVDEVNSGEDDPIPPRGLQEEMIEENGELPQPLHRHHGDGNPSSGAGGVHACAWGIRSRSSRTP